MQYDTDMAQVHYTGESGPIFSLAFKTGLLTLVTLGIYRFWQKTRIRKYVWSSVNAGGDTFEYTGTGIEKLLGFLVAILFLAVYLGAIQMVLFYFGLNLFTEPTTMAQAISQMIAIYVSFFAVLPFVLFALYRARRYKMARTRWRGIRFGMEKGAWGYVARAFGHGLLTLVTLGALLPRQTYHLEKYMTDRSWYGDTRFSQGGKWTEFYGAMTHLFIGIGILIFAGLMAWAQIPVLAAIAGFVGYVWFIVGSIHYQVQSFGYLTRHKRLGETVGFAADPRTGTVMKHYILGGLLVGLISGLVFAVLAGVLYLLTTASGGQPGIAMIVVTAIGYLVALTLLQAFSMVFIVQPIIGHYASTITLTNASGLAAITQRAAETGIDAEGFADALDLGGAI